MLVDRSLGDVKNFADLPGRFSVRHPAQDLDFSSRQLAFDDLSSGQKGTPVSMAFPSVDGPNRTKDIRRQIYW